MLRFSRNAEIEIRQFRWTILYAESLEVSRNVICVTGEKRVEGGGWPWAT